MALATGTTCGGARILYGNPTRSPYTSFNNNPSSSSNCTLPFSARKLHIVYAKKFSPRSGRVDRNNKRGSVSTEDRRSEEVEDSVESDVDDGYVLPELPGDKPDLFEGSQWDALGFFVQYLWAFGIVFALIACGIAVATYNEGATDFKETPAYKESVQSREFLEGPEESNSDVFESNPTEVAPSLE